MKVAFLINELSNLFDNIRDAVVAVKDDEVRYHNSAAENLIPGIGALKPADFLPVQAMDKPRENFRGEVTVSGRRIAVSASTISDYRVYVLSQPQTDGQQETAELLSAAGIELREILSVLKMASGLLFPSIENTGNPRLSKYTALIYHSFYSMLRLTNNISDLGSFLRGDAMLTRSTFDLVASSRALIGTAAHLTADSGAEIRFESNGDSIYICADRPRLDKLLLNLLSNSLKNMTRGGTVTVSVLSTGDRAVLSVSDSGGGIREEALPTAWNRYGAPKDLTELTGGVGLGLAIVQNIARLHGGSAVLETKPGEGTTVTVSLPVAASETTNGRASVADDDGCGMELILTELSDVIGYEKYTQLYMD